MRLRPQARRSPILRDRIAAQNREARRRMRIWYAPFHGLTVFALSLLVFSVLSQVFAWLGLLDGPANYLLVPIAGVGMMSVAPLPMFVPTDGTLDLIVTFLVSFLCGGVVQLARPQWSTRAWLVGTTALLVLLGGVSHFFWRKLGNDWPDWLAYVRDLV